MAKGAKWLRLSIDWDGSEWLCVLSAESQLAWVKFLCYAKGFGAAGLISKRSPITLSRLFAIGEESVRKMLAAAEADGAIKTEGDHWKIVNWYDYQDNGYERLKAHRERKSAQPTKIEPDETLSSVCETRVTVDIDNDIDNKRERRFAPPSLEEVIERAKSVDLSELEARKFHAYYCSVNWVVGKKQMRSWPHALAGWKLRNEPSKPKGPTLSHQEAKELAR